MLALTFTVVWPCKSLYHPVSLNFFICKKEEAYRSTVFKSKVTLVLCLGDSKYPIKSRDYFITSLMLSSPRSYHLLALPTSIRILKEDCSEQ